MARKLRVVVAGGWYHVVNRGNHREAIFRTDSDRRRFLGRLAELPERFRVEIHAFVLMDNHCHLLLRTQEANLSEAIRWLQVSYSSAFNWAHRVRGHLFQGRFRSVLIEDLKGVAEVCGEIPGLKYPAAAAAVKRFGQAQGVDEARKRFVGALRREVER